MALNDLSPGQVQAKYKKVNNAIQLVGLFGIASTAVFCFLPGWVLNWIGSLKKTRRTHYDPNNNDPSLFQQFGFTPVLIMLGSFAVIILVIMLITNWFGLRKRIRGSENIV